MFLNRGGGTFLARGPFFAGAASGALTAADFNGDGVPDLTDTCPDIPSPNQADSDHDGVGDACDDCPSVWDAVQGDFDHDGVGDDCDNCVTAANPGQEDCNNNGKGDACDPFSFCNGYPGEEKVENLFITATGTGSMLTWTTSIETDLVGFNVVTYDQGARVQLNAATIPCQQCTTGGTGSYSFDVPKRRRGGDLFVEMLRISLPTQVFGPAVKR